MIESGSSLGTFLTCPRKYKYSYVDRWESTGYSSPLGFGTFVHAFIEGEKIDSGMPVTQALDRELSRCAEDAHEQIHHDYQLAVSIGAEWKKYWDAKDGHLGNPQLEWSSTEAEWSYQAAPGFTFIGKRDGAVRQRSFNKTYLHEIKTSGDNDRETYVLKLQLDRQISTNIEALQHEGVPCAGAIYDIIWKPRLIRGVNRKTKPDETHEEFRARIIADVQARPDHYFTRVMVQRSAADMEEARKDLAGQFMLAEDGPVAGYPRNQASCEKFGTLCPYFSTCMDNLSPEELGLRRREAKFPELSPAFQASLKDGPTWPARLADSQMRDHLGVANDS